MPVEITTNVQNAIDTRRLATAGAAVTERELAELPYHPRYQHIVAPAGPFGIRLRTEDPAEMRWLDGTIASMEASIARMRNGDPLDEVRDVIKAYRASSRARY